MAAVCALNNEVKSHYHLKGDKGTPNEARIFLRQNIMDSIVNSVEVDSIR